MLRFDSSGSILSSDKLCDPLRGKLTESLSANVINEPPIICNAIAAIFTQFSELGTYRLVEAITLTFSQNYDRVLQGTLRDKNIVVDSFAFTDISDCLKNG